MTSSVDQVVLANVRDIFCNNPDFFTSLKAIVDASSDVSSRLVEYFVTQHSKEEPYLYKDGQGNTINLYQAYSMQLKAYGKRLFDPFRRGSNKFEFRCGEDTVNTTVGQLFFYSWFFKTGAMEHLSKKSVREKVNERMLTSYKESGYVSSVGKKKRVSPKKGCVMPPSNLLVF